jgi:predicted HicB family RNase H-like nuclease
MENLPRKAGRPKTDDPLKYRNVRVSDADWEAYRLAAHTSGVSLSQWIRAALNRAAKRRRKHD